MSVSQSNPYYTFLRHSDLGQRRPGCFQELLQGTNLHIWYWDRSSGSLTSTLRALLASVQEKDVRAVRSSPCTNIDRLPCHAILALSQLPYILELSSCNRRHLVHILLHPSLLPQLDQPQANVLAHR